MTATRKRQTNNAYAGIHRWKPDGAKRHETFEVFYKGRGHKRAFELAGWYWRPLPIVELNGPEETGPFTSSRAAYRDACKQS